MCYLEDLNKTKLEANFSYFIKETDIFTNPKWNNKYAMSQVY